MAGEWVSVKDVSRREVDDVIYDLLVELEERGWRLRRQGHKFYAYCPCGGDDGSMVRIDGTPRNPTGHAGRARRQADHCPDRHDLDG